MEVKPSSLRQSRLGRGRIWARKSRRDQCLICILGFQLDACPHLHLSHRTRKEKFQTNCFRVKVLLYHRRERTWGGVSSAFCRPHKSRDFEIQDESISRGLTERRVLQSGSWAQIYLTRQDKVGRTRKGKENHRLLDTQEQRRLKMAILALGIWTFWAGVLLLEFSSRWMVMSIIVFLSFHAGKQRL
jgi:hypothetical protein